MSLKGRKIGFRKAEVWLIPQLLKDIIWAVVAGISKNQNDFKSKGSVLVEAVLARWTKPVEVDQMIP